MAATTVTETSLPVVLLYFNATKERGKNMLQWRISLQTNFSHFEVERSTNGRTFSSVGRLNYQGDTYLFADNDFGKVINYYRLKIVDRDGKYVYSPVRQLDNRGGLQVSIYPNPAKDNLQVKLESDKTTDVQLQVLSIDGRVISTQRMSVAAGETIQRLNVSSLQKGTYLLSVNYGENEKHVLKFEKQ
jgi:hypothetical protein